MLALTEHDMLFHRYICEWSGRSTLVRAWDPLYSQIQRFVVCTHKQYFADIADIADTHLPTMQALRERDTEHAVQLIREHIMLIWSFIDRTKSQAKE